MSQTWSSQQRVVGSCETDVNSEAYKTFVASKYDAISKTGKLRNVRCDCRGKRAKLVGEGLKTLMKQMKTVKRVKQLRQTKMQTLLNRLKRGKRIHRVV